MSLEYETYRLPDPFVALGYVQARLQEGTGIERLIKRLYVPSSVVSTPLMRRTVQPILKLDIDSGLCEAAAGLREASNNRDLTSCLSGCAYFIAAHQWISWTRAQELKEEGSCIKAHTLLRDHQYMDTESRAVADARFLQGYYIGLLQHDHD